MTNINKIHIQEEGGQNKFDLKTFLNLAILIADCLREYHKDNKVFEFITPSNICWDNENTILLTKNFPDSEEYLYRYISPEQTGRISASIDFRSDLYSLGIVYFEMIYGVPPFSSKDISTLVYQHIATAPEFPDNPCIPATLIAIVRKLLKKNPSERYQSAAGLISDLKQMHDCLLNQKDLDFEIACNDTSNIFCISQSLFGRMHDLTILYDTYQIVADSWPE